MQLRLLLVVIAGCLSAFMGCDDDDSNADTSVDTDTDSGTNTNTDTDTGSGTDVDSDSVCDGGVWEVCSELVFGLESVDGGEPPPCIFDISDVDFYYCESDWTDPQNIVVFGDEEKINFTENCSLSSGWTWQGMDIIDGNEEMELCGNACDKAQAMNWSEVKMSFWCCSVDRSCDN